MASSTTPRFGMVVDLNRCVGCQTCTIACKHANDTPPGVQWRRVLDLELGRYPNVERLFLVTGCQHCAEPPCVPVCPTGATRQRDDGLVTMDYDSCIGCGYCAVACPYQARTIVHDKDWYYGQPTAQEQQVAHDDRIGVATKCTFCEERIDAAQTAGKIPGVDLDYTPACSASCIAQAIHFGNFNEPDSNVSKLLAENNSFQMHAELGTDPQVKYLYEISGAAPAQDHNTDAFGDKRSDDPENPLVGKRQTFWDIRAAMNFILGGMSSGLIMVAYLAHWLGSVSVSALLPIYAVAGIGMAVGLFFVFLEIGRKARFLFVLRRPQSSWMTRETYAVVVFYPALLADLLWPSSILHAIIFLAAAAFLYCQARILYAGKGIPLWRAVLIPKMLIYSGLLEGLGLLTIIQVLFTTNPANAIFSAWIGVILVASTATLWRRYMREVRTIAGPLAVSKLKAITGWLYGLGYGLPVILWLIVITTGVTNNFAPAALIVGGISAVFGGVLWKYTVIVAASYQQGFALPKIPRRGSGTLAAPMRIDQPSSKSNY